MLSVRDKAFIAAAKKLGLLAREQIEDCARIQAKMQAAGEARDLARIALAKGFIDAEGLRKIETLIARSKALSSSPEQPPAEPGPVPHPPPLAESAGADLIEGYQILGKIGEGATAAIYRARHCALEKDVALKVLRPERSKDREYVARFVREARAAAKIDHENIVRIYDAGESKGRYFIAMELVEGRNVEEELSERGPLGERETLEIGREVARALEAVHAAKIVHRDVKPENIMRTAEGRLKLLDLGIARPEEARAGGELTEPGNMLGTPYFVSPEQAGGQEVDIRSDLYSLGVTLYYLATGEHPFTGAAAAEIMRRHLMDPVPSPRLLRPALSTTFDAIVQKLLAKDPKRRYQTPAELVAAFDLALGEGPLEPAPPPRPVPSAAFSPRRAGVAKPAPRPAPEEKARRPAVATLLMAIGGLTVALVALAIANRSLGPARGGSAVAEERPARPAPPVPPPALEAPARGDGEDRSALSLRDGFEEAIRHAREYEAKGEFAMARTALERLVQSKATPPPERERAAAEIAALRERERAFRERAAPSEPAAERPPPPFRPSEAPLATPAGKEGPPAPEPTAARGEPPPKASAPPAPAPPVAKREAPPPPPREPPKPARSKFERALAEAFSAPFVAEDDRTFTATYRFGSGSSDLRDWEELRPPFRLTTGPDGLGIKAASRQRARYLHRVPVTPPFEMEVALAAGRIDPETRFTFVFGEKKGGIDLAAEADGSLAKRKDGEPIRTYSRAGPARALEEPGPVRLSLKVDPGGTVSYFVNGRALYAGVELPEADTPGRIGFEVLSAEIVLREVRFRAAPDPSWLLERIKALPAEQ
jgi:tRNA A-37 threonylcarbamoyl transferase component Bud32